MKSVLLLLILAAACAIACASTGRADHRAADRMVAKMRSIVVPKFEFKDTDIDEVVKGLERASGVDENGHPRVRFRVEWLRAFGSGKLTCSLHDVTLYEAFRLVAVGSGMRWRVEDQTVVLVYIESESIEPRALRELIRRSHTQQP